MKCSIEEKRKILDSFAGKFFSISFVKSSGELREATVKHMMHKLYAEGHASKAHANTVAAKPQYYTCVDAAKESWINCNLETLKKVKCGAVEYEFES